MVKILLKVGLILLITILLALFFGPAVFTICKYLSKFASTIFKGLAYVFGFLAKFTNFFGWTNFI